jgi:hypothetical protein
MLKSSRWTKKVIVSTGDEEAGIAVLLVDYIARVHAGNTSHCLPSTLISFTCNSNMPQRCH